MPRQAPAPAMRWVEMDLGDLEVVVDEHADGMFTIDIPSDRLVVNAEQMQAIVAEFTLIGKSKGWL